MSISVIIPFSKGDKERQEGLNILFACIKAQTFRDFELVLVEMTRDGSSVYLPYKPDQHILLPYDGIMNKSWVCNVGVRKCKHDAILFLDADTQFDESYFAAVFDFYDRFKNKCFVAWDKCMMQAGRDEMTERELNAYHMKAMAHAWFFEKEFYWKTGGMNERYFGYGAEDQDHWERAMHLEKYVPNMPYKIKHTYHHFHPVGSAYPLNERRVSLIENTRNFLDMEIEKLCSLKLGGDKPAWEQNWR
jgi:predicted glycosyltransferase involved in capsule biosynthesis